MTPDNSAAVKIACGKLEPKRQPIRPLNLGSVRAKAIRNWSLPIIEPVSRLPVRILKFTDQRPASEKRTADGR